MYFGGGTPTSITAEEMDLLYEEMYRSFPDVKNIREVTVEAGRPDTITEEKLAVLKNGISTELALIRSLTRMKR